MLTQPDACSNRPAASLSACLGLSLGTGKQCSITVVHTDSRPPARRVPETSAKPHQLAVDVVAVQQQRPQRQRAGAQRHVQRPQVQVPARIIKFSTSSIRRCRLSNLKSVRRVTSVGMSEGFTSSDSRDRPLHAWGEGSGGCGVTTACTSEGVADPARGCLLLSALIPLTFDSLQKTPALHRIIACGERRAHPRSRRPR